MLRMIFAGIAAATIGTIGGLTLVAATPAKGPTPQVKLTNAAPEIAPSSPKTADPVLIAAPGAWPRSRRRHRPRPLRRRSPSPRRNLPLRNRISQKFTSTAIALACASASSKSTSRAVPSAHLWSA